MITIGSLFSGIGGLERGLELGLAQAGIESRVAWQVEIDPWCRRVLAKHWPDATRHVDVREVGHGVVPRVDLLCGGFPCQDLSRARPRKGDGLDGAQSGLWSEYLRIVCELEPSLVIVENVVPLRRAGLPSMLASLAAAGFDASWSCIAVGEGPRTHGYPHVGGVHERQRLFLVAAHPDRVDLRDIEQRLAPGRHDVPTSRQAEPRGDGAAGDAARWPGAPTPCVRRVDDGLPRGLDRRRHRALGNAVSVDVSTLLGHAIGRSLIGA